MIILHTLPVFFYTLSIIDNKYGQINKGVKSLPYNILWALV